MNTRRRKLGALSALLALASIAPSGPSAQDLPIYSPHLACSGSSASAPQNTTLITQLPCEDTGLLRDVATGNIRTVAGNGTLGWTGDGGIATEATLNQPEGVVVDRSGNLYIADSFNHLIRRVDASTGIITTIAGIGEPGFGGDGGPASEAQLSQPRGMALDAAGHLFFSEVGNRRIRRIDAGTGIITTVVGGGQISLDGVPATEVTGFFNLRGRLAFDAAGDLFFVDADRIRRVSAGEDGLLTGALDEIITTVAGVGTSGFSGDDGPARSAEFWSPFDLDFDPLGNLYIADTLNHRVRRVAPGSDGLLRGDEDEIVTTVAGGGESTDDGIPATSALLFRPVGVSVDPSGNVHFTAMLLTNLRRIDALTGVISTVAGGGNALGEDIPAATAALGGYFAFDFDVEGNVFIPEWSAHRIRAVHLSTPFTYEIVEGPSHGLASLSADGELQYEPNSDFVGDDTITFRARDAVGRPTPTATLSITVTAVDADVAVAMTALPVSGVSEEGKITYTVTVTNHGPADATNVSLLDVLPNGINLRYVTLAPSQGTCSQTQNVVTCVLGSIANDATATVSIVVHPLTTGAMTNSVSVSADPLDPDTLNNATSVSSAVTTVLLTDLRIVQIDSPDPVVAGKPLTYRLTVTHLTNTCANDVVVSDLLPQTVDLLSVTPSQGTCTGLSCNLGRMCPGESATITIVVTPTDAGTLVNTAIVQDRPSDPAANNMATATTRVVPATVVLNVAETVGVSDSIQLLPAAMINVSENVVVSDRPLVVPPVVLSVSESVTVSDGVAVVPPVIIGVSESITVGDAVGMLPAVLLRVSESVSVLDAAGVLPAVLLRVSESVAVLDGVGVIPPVVIRVSESVGVADGVRLLPVIMIKVTEGVTVTDSPIVR